MALIVAPPPLSSLPRPSPYLSFRCFLGPSLRHRFCSPQCPRRPLLLPLPSAAALAAATSSSDPWSISLFSDLSCRSRSSIWKSRGNISVEAFQLGRPRKERPAAAAARRRRIFAIPLSVAGWGRAPKNTAYNFLLFRAFISRAIWLQWDENCRIHLPSLLIMNWILPSHCAVISGFGAPPNDIVWPPKKVS